MVRTYTIQLFGPRTHLVVPNMSVLASYGYFAAAGSDHCHDVATVTLFHV